MYKKGDGNGWSENEKLVLHVLNQQTRDIENLRSEIQKMHIEIASLKVKSGILGLIAGTIPAAVAILLKLLG